MAGDEEVEAVARDANPAYDAATHDETREHWRRQAKVYIEAVDRVRSRPANGTEGEGHEAEREKVARAIDPEAFEAPILVSYRERAFKAADAAIAVIEAERALSPVSGTEPDTASRERAVMSRLSDRLRQREPDTAKLLAALAEIAHYEHATAAGQGLVQYMVKVAREALAGFSVDAEKPESRPERDITDVFRSDEAMRAFGVERPDEAGPDGR